MFNFIWGEFDHIIPKRSINLWIFGNNAFVTPLHMVYKCIPVQVDFTAGTPVCAAIIQGEAAQRSVFFQESKNQFFIKLMFLKRFYHLFGEALPDEFTYSDLLPFYEKLIALFMFFSFLSSSIWLWSLLFSSPSFFVSFLFFSSSFYLFLFLFHLSFPSISQINNRFFFITISFYMSPFSIVKAFDIWSSVF